MQGKERRWKREREEKENTHWRHINSDLYFLIFTTFGFKFKHIQKSILCLSCLVKFAFWFFFCFSYITADENEKRLTQFPPQHKEKFVLLLRWIWWWSKKDFLFVARALFSNSKEKTKNIHFAFTCMRKIRNENLCFLCCLLFASN